MVTYADRLSAGIAKLDCVQESLDAHYTGDSLVMRVVDIDNVIYSIEIKPLKRVGDNKVKEQS